MAMNFFLACAGVMLGGAAALWLLIKQFAVSFAEKPKGPLMLGVLCGVFTSLLAFCATYLITDLFVLFWVLAVIFLGSGILLTALEHKKFRKNELEENGAKLFVGELFFNMAVVLFTLTIFLVLQYFLKDRNFLFYPVLMSALAFFIPFLLAHTFDAAYGIPTAVFSTWQYPAGRALDPPEEKEGEQLLVIGFEIAKKRTDGKKTYFRARAPEGIGLGDLFYHFINDYNELQSETPIQFLDRPDEPQQWWYRRKPKWYQGARVLDPAMSIVENGIVENSVIICERLAPES